MALDVFAQDIFVDDIFELGLMISLARDLWAKSKVLLTASYSWLKCLPIRLKNLSFV